MNVQFENVFFYVGSIFNLTSGFFNIDYWNNHEICFDPVNIFLHNAAFTYYKKQRFIENTH